MKTSGTVRARFCGVIIVDLEASEAQAVARVEARAKVTLPLSSAMAIDSALKVEPIS